MYSRSYIDMIKWTAQQEYDIYSSMDYTYVLGQMYGKDPNQVHDDVKAELEQLREAAITQLAKKYRCVTCKDQGWYRDSSACDFGGPSVKISCEACGTGRIIWGCE
jgi:hypothetical protein